MTAGYRRRIYGVSTAETERETVAVTTGSESDLSSRRHSQYQNSISTPDRVRLSLSLSLPAKKEAAESLSLAGYTYGFRLISSLSVPSFTVHPAPEPCLPTVNA